MNRTSDTDLTVWKQMVQTLLHIGRSMPQAVAEADDYLAALQRFTGTSELSATEAAFRDHLKARATDRLWR